MKPMMSGKVFLFLCTSLFVACGGGGGGGGGDDGASTRLSNHE
jgi:hypothetical protein